MNNPLIYWLIFSVAEAIRHVYLIKVKKKSPKKGFSLGMRAVVAGILLYFEWKADIRPNVHLVLAYIVAGWFIHNTIIAVSLGKKPWYLNNTGPIDRALRNYAPYLWFLLAIAFLGLVGGYFLNYPT